ncbi:MAG: hypothetical protein Q8M09_05870 [Pseudomonadota bacterium]|nr:hypothetical protein [Pseudomonadota bacterium]MDP1903758.1 hypothetical protein [Pseudomonadota bacterium]
MLDPALLYNNSRTMVSYVGAGEFYYQPWYPITGVPGVKASRYRIQSVTGKGMQPLATARQVAYLHDVGETIQSAYVLVPPLPGTTEMRPISYTSLGAATWPDDVAGVAVNGITCSRLNSGMASGRGRKLR